MLDLLLLNPPLSGRERYGNLAIGGSYMPPLGLAQLAAVARENGYSVEILDAEALGYSIKQTVNHIVNAAPRYLGITSTTIAIYKAGEIAEQVKKRLGKDTVIILGGAHISAVSKITMEIFSGFDIGVLGEGEETLAELLDALDKGKDTNNIQGLIIRKDADIVITPPRPFMKDLDRLPLPAWDIIDGLTKYYKPSVFGFKKLPITSLVTSRGCPGKCSFCNQGPWGKMYREFSAERVMEMMRILYYEYGIRDIAIYDGLFGVNRKRLTKLCNLLVKENWDLVWSANARVDMVNPKMLKMVKEAGCWSLAYGIESGAPSVLRFIQKYTTPEQILTALKWTKDAGMVAKGYIMYGTPTETEETMKETLELILKADLDLLTVNHFTPFPGTLDYTRAKDYGTFNDDWRHLNEHQIVFIPRGLTAERIEDYIRKTTWGFYMRPRIIRDFLKRFRDQKSALLLSKGALAFLMFTLRKTNNT